MAAADRAINMAMRIQGVGEVERDFKRVGAAGNQAFSQIARSANGAAREVSDYTARLKRVAASARADFANLQELHKGDALTVARNRNAFVLDRVRAEQGRIRSGLPDMSLPGAAAGAREVGLLRSALTGLGGVAGAAGVALGGLMTIVAAGTAEYQAHERALASFNATLSLAGNLSNASAKQIQDMAARVSAATLQTEASTLKAAAALAKVPGITSDVLEQAIDASARYADAMEDDVAGTAAKAGAVLTALAKNDLKGLVNAIDDLSDPLQKAILDLAQAGKTAEAQQLYLRALAQAAGKGPGGLASGADAAADSWRQLKSDIGALSSGPVETVMSAIAFSLNTVRGIAVETGKALLYVASLGNMNLYRQAPLKGSASDAVNVGMSAFGKARGFATGSPLGMATAALGESSWSAADSKALAAQRDAILHPEKAPPAGGRRGGGSGKSEEDRLKREADAAREAADRVLASNDDIVESYRDRADEASARLGLEGAALEAVIRQQAIDTAAKRLSADQIEKVVAAKRAEAALAHAPFDEAAARRAASEALADQTDTLRHFAAAEYDANKAQEDFVKQQEFVASIVERTRTPMEQAAAEIERLVDAYDKIDPDTFARQIHQMAEELVDAGGRVRNAWTGLGDDISRSLGSIVVDGRSPLSGGKDIVRSIAWRIFDQQIGNPLTERIDGLTGNSRSKNVAAAEQDLAAMAAARLAEKMDAAALAAQRYTVTVMGDVIDPIAAEADAGSLALKELAKNAGGAGSVLAQVISSLSTAGGGSGGLLGSLLNFGINLIGGSSGGGIGTSNGGGSLKAGGKTSGLPGFAGGGSPPIGMPFSVGENGKEIMYLMPGGGARVLSGEQTRRAGGFGGTPNVNITVNGARGNSEIRQMVSEGVSAGIARYDREVGGRVQDNLARYG